MTQRAIDALERLYDRDVRVELMLASRPEVRRAIIESLPSVKELLELGPEAGPDILNFFEREDIQADDGLAGVALYLLQRIPSEQAVKPLARYLKSGKLSGMNSELAAQAFLTTARIESVNDDPVSVAIREADKFI
jgi:hypothetical protein